MGKVTRFSFVAVLAICILALVIISFPHSSVEQEVASSLREIYIAIVQYCDTKDQMLYPKLDVGGIAHSWRVEIYPWLPNNSFYGEYDQSLPFDAPQNWRSARRVMVKESREGITIDPGEIYSVADDIEARKNGWTSFLWICGEGTFGEGFLSSNEVADGNANTILIVFAMDSGVFWTNPQDLEVSLKLSHPSLDSWLRKSPKYALFADGSVRRLANDLSVEEFLSLCTCQGGENVDVSRHVKIK